MRITAGQARGRRLKAAGRTIRPTASKVREAIFNIIGPSVEDSAFLDLYAGTGAVGLEALSRGAGRSVFVDINTLRADLIKKVAEEFGFSSSARVYRMGSFTFLKKAVRENMVFDFIFVDPPYRTEEIMKVLPFIAESGILSRDGMVLVEHFSKKRLPDQVGKLIKRKEYSYGDTALTSYNIVE